MKNQSYDAFTVIVKNSTIMIYNNYMIFIKIIAVRWWLNGYQQTS